MGTLVLTRIFPNPPGKDASYGQTTNEKLNGEWVELTASNGDRSLVGDTLLHKTFHSGTCTVSGAEGLITFPALTLPHGASVRVHTGSGTPWWEGAVLHYYLGKRWFVWNNGCGDQASIVYSSSVVDWAYYDANPPERVLHRVSGTNRFA